MRLRSTLFVLAVLLVAGMSQPAAAVVQYYNVFKAEYLDNHADKEFAAAVNKANVKCLVCHQGKERKHHNAFGIHLVDVLDRKKDTKDKEKISTEIKKALELHVDPKDDKSETYMDRLKASKWPGGELEDLKKEPPKEEGQATE